MRDIKFRGKRLDNGEWVYGYYFISERDIEDGFVWRDIPQIQQRYGDHYQYFDVIPETIGQYTGLKDKNGREIYEGDICSTDLSRPYLIVLFRNGAFMYQCHDDGNDYFDIMLPIEEESETDNYTEVIGNIHDNPELLKLKEAR
ncbi:MAG: hypothetical protein GXX10_01755 [Clostridiaceae bacterium]|nr:hypothetical protein [Clostridiaceae bacterium]